MLLKGVLLAMGALLAATALAEADYYTWVDENGVTNYAEKKPVEYDARLVTRSYRFGYRMPDADVLEEEGVDEGTSSEEEQAKEEVDPEALIAEERAKFEAQLAEEKRFNCDVGKKNLTRLETFGRIRIRGDDGNERLMSPEEMEVKKTESRALIRENCTV
jgi:Domain of unknown function (DUF4124)